MIVRSTDIKNSFGKYLKLLDQEDIIVIRNGSPVARITRQEEWPENDRGCEMAERYGECDVCGGRKMSYEEFIEMYENTEDRYEYIDGEAYLLASPKITHQGVLGNLYSIFRLWFKGKTCTPYLSPFDVILKNGVNNMNVVQPDMLVVCDPENKNEKDKYTGTPALVIEILSAATNRMDLVRKLDLYMQTGIKEYWIVNYVNKEVTVYQFIEKDIASMKTYTKEDAARSFIFDGLAADLKDIFE